MNLKRSLLIALYGVLVFSALATENNTPTVFGQSPPTWTQMHRIAGIADDANPPYLVADQNHTVHAVTSQLVGASLAVFYTQWTLKGGWTKPIDILLSPNKDQATVQGAFLDSKGMLHVIFYGGNEKDAQIYYSRAPALNAGQTRAWSPPKMVGIGAASPVSAALAGDEKGNLFIVYGGNREGNGVYEIHSKDGGETWSKPFAVFLNDRKSLLTAWLQLQLDDQGWLHAIWTVASASGQGRGIYYARMNVREGRWKLPLRLANTPEGLGVREPAIIEQGGRVFTAFYDADTGGRLTMRISNDGGQTWGDLIVPFPQYVGANGIASFVVDGNNVLHLFWGQRLPGNPDIHGMWHSIYRGDQWAEPEPVVSGVRTTEFDPSVARAVVSQGNVVLVTWRQDPGWSDNGVWYSYSQLNAPELPAVELPIPAPSPSPDPTATAIPLTVIPSPSPLPAIAGGQSDDPGGLTGNPTIMLILSAAPVLVLIIAILLYYNSRNVFRS